MVVFVPRLAPYFALTILLVHSLTYINTQCRHEQVLLFDGLTTIFERPAMQQLDNIEDLQHRWRSDLGISTEQRIYLLPHTIMKYSPGMQEQQCSHHIL
jgi:hypothetical protein